MRRITLLVSALFCLGAAPTHLDSYRVRIGSQLKIDQWMSGYGYDVRQTDINYRLQLDAAPTWAQSRGVSFIFDSDLGTDLGPDSGYHFRSEDTRLTRIDLYRAEVRLNLTVPGLVLRLGRHSTYDALGFASMDGVSVRSSHLPGVDLVGHAGLGLQTRWLSVGPILPRPIDTVGRDRLGYLMGAGLETRGFQSFGGSLAWRRHVADTRYLEMFGTQLSLRPARWLTLSTGGAGDLLVRRIIDAEFTIDTRPTRATRLSLRTRYHAPHFPADTIWIAFAPAPYHGADLTFATHQGAWQGWLQVEGRTYAPAEVVPDASWHKPSFDGGATAWLARASLERALSTPRARFGSTGQANYGFGGTAAVGSLYCVYPLAWPLPHRGVLLNGRLGLAWYEDAVQATWDGVSGWSVLGVLWAPSEGLEIGGQLEGFVSEREQTRARAMLTAQMEAGW